MPANTVTAGELVSGLGALPAVSEHVTATPEASAPPAAPAVNKGGRPKGRRDSRPRKRPSRTIPQTPAPAEGSVVGPDPEPAPAAAEQPVAPGPDRYELAADLYLRAFYSATDGVMAGAGEWAPDNEEEHVELRSALAAYLRHKGVEDLPPGPALALALGAYAAKRVQRPRTSTSLRTWWLWLRARWGSYRAARRIEAMPAPSPGPMPHP